MLLSRVISFDDAIAAVNWNTIALLLGMMLIIGAIQEDGSATALADFVLARAKTPTQLLVLVVVSTGVASAFLVNDAVVLAVTPFLVAACRARDLNPIPFLLAEAMASNLGGVATITGNPQNAVIGITSGISFGSFLLHLLPVALASVAVLLTVVRWRYRGEFAKAGLAPNQLAPPRAVARPRMTRSLAILLLTVLGFLLSRALDTQIAVIALGGGAAALLLSGKRPDAVLRQVDWVLLLLFAGLFVVIGGAVKEGLFDRARDAISLNESFGSVAGLHGAGLAISQAISNVPYTLLMLPIFEGRGTDLLWLSLASGATLAGNATILGSIANIIVIEGAREHGVEVRFVEYALVGLPVALITGAASVTILWVEHLAGAL